MREQRENADAAKAAAAETVAGCPDPANHYATEVNKGSINMTLLQGHLANRFRQGYRLAHVLEQDKNTIMVFEHAHS